MTITGAQRTHPSAVTNAGRKGIAANGMKQRIPQLDAVRGIAILIVMVHNSAGHLTSLPFQRVLSFGWMGVDLFFVLSGFLITGILLDTNRSPEYFKNFYARRCLRIWPLYFTLLLLMFVAIPLLRPSVGAMVTARSSPWWAYPLFLQNFLVQHPSAAVGPLGVTWSVAIEEQFYLVWALVVRFCSSTHLRWIAISVIRLSPLVRLCLLLHHVNLYTSIFCRMDGLMAGSLVAMAIRSENFDCTRFLTPAWIAFLMALPLACLADCLDLRWVSYSFSSMASLAFVYVVLFAPQGWLLRIMTHRALTYTGVISYGLYLLHKLPLDVEVSLGFERRPIAALLMELAASYVIATVSWFIFEKPFLRLKRLFEFRSAPQLAPAAGQRNVALPR